MRTKLRFPVLATVSFGLLKEQREDGRMRVEMEEHKINWPKILAANSCLIIGTAQESPTLENGQTICAELVAS